MEKTKTTSGTTEAKNNYHLQLAAILLKPTLTLKAAPHF